MSEWTKIDSIFDEALDLPESERSAFIREACGENEEMLAEVEALLKVAEKPGSSLDAAAAEIAAPMIGKTIDDDIDSLLGEVVDSKYQLIKPLGRGGMGVVYLSRQIDGQVERDVALKLTKRGMDTDLVLSRFRRERNVLASLLHPNIASLLDAGTMKEGRPYFAMEYVDGIQIDEFCEKNSLGVKKRLELFLQACEAVQFAHSNLVVHRDLKPSNILVDTAGHVKLLDFGIAKLLDGEELDVPQTLTTDRALTPAYASPEQFTRSRISTASDVYSLGIILYELLSGERPFDFKEKSTGQIEELALNRRPRKPSIALAQPRTPGSFSNNKNDPNYFIKGDLDVICLHALEKEPSKRYNSVNEFARDIRRYLSGRTIGARPASLAYRFRTFSRRNKFAIATGVVVAGLLVASSVFSMRQAKLAEQAAGLASVEAEKANKTVDFVVDILKEVGPKEREGEPITGKAIIQAGVSKAGELNQLPLVKAKMLATMGNISYHLGEYLSADSLLRESLALRKAAEPQLSVEISESLYDLGINRRSIDRDFAGALSFLLEADSLLRYSAPNSIQAMNVGFETAKTYYMLDQHEKALEMLEELLTKNDSLGLAPTNALGIGYSTMGSILVGIGRHEEALPAYETAYKVLSNVEGKNDPSTLGALMGIGMTQFRSGRFVEAKNTLEGLIKTQEKVFGPNHSQTGNGYIRLAMAYRGLKDYDAAIANDLKAYEIYKLGYGPDHFYTAFPFRDIGQAYTDQGLWQDAERSYTRSMKIVKQASGVRKLHPFVIRLETLLANSLSEQGKYEEAARVLDKTYRDFLSIEEDLDPLFDDLYTKLCDELKRAYEGSSRLELANDVPASFR